MIHELKELPEYFEPVSERQKPFELRKNDRDFRVGDYLALNEWTKEGGYTGRALLARIVYILDPNEVATCVPGYVILGIELVRVERPGGLAYKGATIELDNPRSEVTANG